MEYKVGDIVKIKVNNFHDGAYIDSYNLTVKILSFEDSLSKNDMIHTIDQYRVTRIFFTDDIKKLLWREDPCSKR